MRDDRLAAGGVCAGSGVELARRHPGPLSRRWLGEYAHRVDPNLDDLIGPPTSPAEVDAVEVDGERPADTAMPEIPRLPLTDT
jgi:hypothetical protein